MIMRAAVVAGILFMLNSSAVNASDWEWISVGGMVANEDGARTLQIGVHRWAIGDATDGASEWSPGSLYPTWVGFHDPSTRANVVDQLVRLERSGWDVGTSSASPLGLTAGSVRTTTWTPTDFGWTMQVATLGRMLDIDLRRTRSAIEFVDRVIHPELAITVRESGRAEAEFEGRGAWVSGVRQFDEFAHVEGEDFFFFTIEGGGTVAVSRVRDSRIGKHSQIRGVVAGARGAVLDLEPSQIHFYPLGTARWKSPATGYEYPTRWRLEIPAIGLDCDLTPIRVDQEIDGSDAWGGSVWQGAVRVSGYRNEARVDAVGELLLTGYGDAFPPRVLVAESATLSGR